jgi:thiol:disulfide interchange protein DsbC
MTMNKPRLRAEHSARHAPIVAAALAAWLAAALPCAAATTTDTDQQAATRAIGQRLSTQYPSTHFGAINTTAWPGVFEVVMGANLAYVDPSGQYFLFGHLYDMKSQRDLSAERKDGLARIDFDALPLADAIKEVRGTGGRVLAIFSDPDCPYCRKLEADLRELSDVTLYTFLMPLVSLHPQAHAKAVSLWCAKNPSAAWHALMWRGEEVTPAACPHPVDRNVALGERLGINGTPTLIAADGRMLPGAASKEQVEAWLARSAAPAPVSAEGTAR